MPSQIYAVRYFTIFADGTKDVATKCTHGKLRTTRERRCSSNLLPRGARGHQAARLRAMPTAADMARDQDKVDIALPCLSLFREIGVHVLMWTNEPGRARCGPERVGFPLAPLCPLPPPLPARAPPQLALSANIPEIPCSPFPLPSPQHVFPVVGPPDTLSFFSAALLHSMYAVHQQLFKKEVDLLVDPGIKREFMYSAKDWKTAPTAENKIPEWVQQAKMRAPGLPQTPPPPPPMQIPPRPRPRHRTSASSCKASSRRPRRSSCSRRRQGGRQGRGQRRQGREG